MKRSSFATLFITLTLNSLFLFGCKNADNTLAPPPPGPDWVTIRRPAVSALLDNKINTMALGIDGKVWIATDSGASSYLQNSWGAIRDSLRYPVFGSSGSSFSWKVTAISPGRDGSVWFGLAGGGIKRYHSGSATTAWQTYVQPEIAFNTISAISADVLVFGDVWVATPIAGISRYVPHISLPDQGTWFTYTSGSTPQILTNQIKCTSFNDLTNTVWFGTYLGLISYNETDLWGNLTLPPDHSGDIVSIAFDNANTIWMAKNGGTELGVTSYNKTTSTFTHYTFENTSGKLPAGGVNVVATDIGSTRWFGTNAGLVRFQDTTWTTFNTVNTPELPSDTVTSLIIDRRSNLWIGTPNGIAVFNEGGTRF